MTTEGLALEAASKAEGGTPINFTHIEYGATQGNPTAALTSVPGAYNPPVFYPILRVSSTDNVLFARTFLGDQRNFTAYGVGLFANGTLSPDGSSIVNRGTLYAILQHTTAEGPVQEKSPNSRSHFQATVQHNGANITQLTVNIEPVATETNYGSVEYATDAEIADPSTLSDELRVADIRQIKTLAAGSGTTNADEVRNLVANFIKASGGSITITRAGNELRLTANIRSDEDIRNVMATMLVSTGNINVTVDITGTGASRRLRVRVPDASTTVAGVVELATNTETQTGTSTNRAVTPGSLSSRTATETRTGIAELANKTEATTATDTTRIMTPARTSDLINARRVRVANKAAWEALGAARRADTEYWWPK